MSFLSTPSARRATAVTQRSSSTPTFLSTPSARRATRVGNEYADLLFISIHALREEGDGYVEPLEARKIISIHALREEGDGVLQQLGIHPES